MVTRIQFYKIEEDSFCDNMVIIRAMDGRGVEWDAMLSCYNYGYSSTYCLTYNCQGKSSEFEIEVRHNYPCDLTLDMDELIERLEGLKYWEIEELRIPLEPSSTFIHGANSKSNNFPLYDNVLKHCWC
jgi:hypothetical protein